MALEQIKTGLAIRTKKDELKALEERWKGFIDRMDTLSRALQEAETQEDVELLTRQTEELEGEIGDTDFESEIQKLKDEIAELESKLEEMNKKPADPKPEDDENNEERRVNKPMNRRSLFYKLPAERRQNILADEKVRTFLEQTRAVLKREVTGVKLTVPKQMTDLVKENIERYSKVLPYIKVESVSGDATVPILGVSPEGIWSDATGALKEVDLAFYEVEVGNFLISSYIPVNNVWLKDSDADLAANIIEALGKGTGKAIDRAVIYGKGVKMPLGIVTRLAQTVKPDTWPADAPEWKDLHESNIKTYDLASKNGTAFFKQIAEVAGIPSDDYADDSFVWFMNHKTAMKFRANALAFDSSAALQAKVDKEMPGIGGVIVEVPCIPTGDVVAGYGNLYAYGEREEITMAQSGHVKFLNNETVFACLARGDGRPVFGEAFVLFNINNVAPTTEVAFPTGKASA